MNKETKKMIGRTFFIFMEIVFAGAICREVMKSPINVIGILVMLGFMYLFYLQKKDY